ncbi:MAG TPA: tetratricopeptide repeat protein, partial [Gemmatimonadaceae bacterium]|nr:tetratricopeptide repeat protein [Gemmatimonadaceae bacterium]
MALSRKPPSRDWLATMFWGDEDNDRARHSVSDALSHIRRVLGRDSIAARSSDVVLADNVALAIDAVEFAAACETGDHARAYLLYTGPFLADVGAGMSTDFDRWVERERDRYRRLFVRACESHVPSLARNGDWTACATAAERWLEAAPESADAALYLLKSLSADDSRDSATAALDRYEALVVHLAHEHDTRPAENVQQFAAELSARLKRADLALPQVSPSATPAANNPGRHAGRLHVEAPPKRSWRRITAFVALPLIVAAAVIASRRLLRSDSSRSTTSTAKPVIAITHVRNVRADSSVAWLVDGFNQMLASDLSRSTAVEVITPARIREVVERTGQSDTAAPTSMALDVASRVGATLSVSAGITRGNDIYVIDVTVRSVANGQVVRMFAVTGSNILLLADQAAARILDAANAHAPGPRLAEIETSNVAAFQHYVRAVQAHEEGRSADQIRELDLAIQGDSGFVSAITARLRIAEDMHDHEVVARLATAFDRSSSRATDWDRLEHAEWTAFHNGEHLRAESLGAELVRRYPHDPRAYSIQAEILTAHGKWTDAASVLERALSLDSLAVEAGHGPCAPCTAYDGLVSLYRTTGDLDAAEHDARRWIALEPDAPAAWIGLGLTLVYRGKFGPAVDAARRASMLAGDDPDYAISVGRILLMARRYAAVDSAIADWRARSNDTYRMNAGDLEAMLQRERGQYRASSATVRHLDALYPEETRGLLLVVGDNLARIGQPDSAARLYETVAHSRESFNAQSPYYPLDGDDARGFSWHHALEAEALAHTGDTARMRILADSIELVSARSYYWRDRELPHHIRGLIAMRASRPNDAIREFQQARWGVSGWTTTVVHISRAMLQLGNPQKAIETLRYAYMEPPDAMGRYEPRSELDLLMAEEFRQAGQADSSA